MRVIVNGEPRELMEGAVLGDLLSFLRVTDKAIIVERNGEILRRADQEGTPLCEGDRLEVVHLVGGG